MLEACVKNCGKRFHEELGKFRFLNEVIKMLSPKYRGNQTALTVKQRMSSLLYSWKVGLPGEPKINEAYQMLTEQGLVFDESAPRDPVSIECCVSLISPSCNMRLDIVIHTVDGEFW